MFALPPELPLLGDDANRLLFKQVKILGQILEGAVKKAIA